MRLYLDSSAIIYSIEDGGLIRDVIFARMAQALAAPNGVLITSQLSILECRIKPLRNRDASVLAIYDKWFSQRVVRVCEINREVIDLATEIRAQFGLKTPDAIHAATAQVERADLLLTGDRGFGRAASLINIEVLKSQTA